MGLAAAEEFAQQPAQQLQHGTKLHRAERGSHPDGGEKDAHDYRNLSG